jgi:hypothetical protein
VAWSPPLLFGGCVIVHAFYSRHSFRFTIDLRVAGRTKRSRGAVTVPGKLAFRICSKICLAIERPLLLKTTWRKMRHGAERPLLPALVG